MTDPSALTSLSSTCHALIAAILHADTDRGSPSPWSIAADAFMECDSWTWDVVEALVIEYPQSEGIRMLANRWLEMNGQSRRINATINFDSRALINGINYQPIIPSITVPPVRYPVARFTFDKPFIIQDFTVKTSFLGNRNDMPTGAWMDLIFQTQNTIFRFECITIGNNKSIYFGGEYIVLPDVDLTLSTCSKFSSELGIYLTGTAVDLPS